MGPATVGITAGLGLLGYALLKQPSLFPDDQGEFGLTDLELYENLESRDPLGEMSFSQAVNSDPRRIEGLLLQRIIQPLMFSIAKMQGPTVPMAQIRLATKSGYLQMMSDRRKKGPITAQVIAKSLIEAWQIAGDVMMSAQQAGQMSAYVPVLKMIIAANMRDISRSFREAEQICKQAQKKAVNAQESNAYGQICAVMNSMQTAIHFFVSSAKRSGGKGEPVDADMGFGDTFGGLGEAGIVEQQDLFGAFQFEEYMVSGHRAPSIGLSQYRRMGGRVY